jgi:diguanylate cyclase (GGDEF)-like protein/PAS domain S-box-containing protein
VFKIAAADTDNEWGPVRLLAAGRSVIHMRFLTSRAARPLVLYAAIFVVTWGLLLTTSSLRVGMVAEAFVLQVVVGALLYSVDRWDRHRWAGVVGASIFLVSVALLRSGVGQTAGYGSLVLLPVVWASLRRRRAELVWTIGGAAVVLFAPIVLIGGARYPSTAWRSSAVLLVIAAVIGVAVLELVEHLRSSQERQRLLAENSTDLVAVLAPDSTITYASLSSAAVLGYTPGELVGLKMSDLLHPVDRDQLDQRRARVDATHQTVQLEFRLRHHDESWVWCEATVRAIRDVHGAVTERQAAIRPIDERKRLQLTVERQRDDATNLLAEQHALREIATLVAAGAEPSAVFLAVAEQLAQLFDTTVTGVNRFDPPAGLGVMVGGWSANGADVTGQTVDLAGTSATARVYQTGATAKIAEYENSASEPILEAFALRGAVSAPIIAEGRLWGSVGLAFAADASIPADAEQRLTSFAGLVSLAISSAEALETLSRQATTDPMTGLANYRTFHERLGSEVERSVRHGRALSVAVLDLDHFKQVNDTHGHQTGDRVLVEVARRLAAAVRSGELMARIGGEEFAWLMPEATDDGAFAAAERVRRAIAETPFDTVGGLTISVGVCSNQQAQTGEELVDRADQALYWSKRGGRNTTLIYTHAARQMLPPVNSAHARSEEYAR